MNLLDLAIKAKTSSSSNSNRKIPWNDPEFSKRMLLNHLDQTHDWASRRLEIIKAQTAFIAGQLNSRQGRILDLGCGPGLYLQELAALGHSCVGIDFSPASIEYAIQQAADKNLNIEYILDDITTADYGTGFDIVLMSFGEINVFNNEEALSIINKAYSALNDNGLFILEAHTLNEVRNQGRKPTTWTRHDQDGLFSNKPHLCLQENIWQLRSSTASTYYYIIDAATAQVTEYCSVMTGYSKKEYENILQQVGFNSISILDQTQWPSGEIILDKFVVYNCQKNS